jgi:hypothetical protein
LARKENPRIFQTREVIRADGATALKTAGKPANRLRKTKEMYLLKLENGIRLWYHQASLARSIFEH